MSDVGPFVSAAFVTLLVVVDPVGLAPIFTSLARGQDAGQRRRTLTRAIAVALSVVLFFLLAGRFLIAQLGVTVHAFSIAGGILLFATALPMLFGHRPALQGEDHGAAPDPADPAVFPLAIPLLAGPGAIATALLLASRAEGDPLRIAALCVVTVAVFVISGVVLAVADRLMGFLGEARIQVLTRVLGIVLAALAVQYVLDGFAAYYATLGATGRGTP